MAASTVLRTPGRRIAAVGLGSAAPVLLGLAIAVELAGLATIALSAGARRSFLLPAARHAFPDWLRGPLGPVGPGLSSEAFAVVVLAMVIAYGLAIVAAHAVAGRWPLVLIVLAIALGGLAPPLLSADLFGYLAWGRLGVDGLNPYVHPSIAVGDDPIRPFLLWHEGSTPYGPVFTLLTYPLAAFGVAVGLWALKGVAAAAALACVALLWHTARRLGRSPLPAVVAFALNPLVLVYAVAGAHNDLLLDAIVLAGVLAAVAGRERAAGGGVAVAAAIEA
ncbi:MAG: glycosyltransferase 87 family protein, partial [Actinomycetota bacterium]|nr:glycosyltransferase 87 family protein [Actinomycetota bacterium]